MIWDTDLSAMPSITTVGYINKHENTPNPDKVYSLFAVDDIWQKR